MIRYLAALAGIVGVLVLLAPAPSARSGTSARPSVSFVEAALCVHSGSHYTSKRPHPGARPEYVLWHHGYWRTWKLPYGYGSEGEGAWNATSDPRYGGGLSFTLGTWNTAADRSHGSVPHASSTSAIAAQPAAVQILAAWFIVSVRGNWKDWPQTSRACGLLR